MTEIVYAGRVIKLAAPASQDLELKGTGALVSECWAPEDKGAQELEIRARILAASSGIGTFPVIRWSVEVGHGNTNWTQPHLSLNLVAGTPMLNYSLPARGMVWRTSSRIFRIAFANQGTITGAALPSSTVQVSVNPVLGGFVPVYPYQHLAFPVAGVQQPFPMAAREWRLRDSQGRPLALGALSVLFTGVLGGLFGASDGALYSTYGPIPHEAVSFSASAPVYVDYR